MFSYLSVFSLSLQLYSSRAPKHASQHVHAPSFFLALTHRGHGGTSAIDILQFVNVELRTVMRQCGSMTNFRCSNMILVCSSDAEFILLMAYCWGQGAQEGCTHPHWRYPSNMLPVIAFMRNEECGDVEHHASQVQAFRFSHLAGLDSSRGPYLCGMERFGGTASLQERGVPR